MRAGVRWIPPQRAGMERLPAVYLIEGIPVRCDPKFYGFAEARGVWPFKWIRVGRRFFQLSFGEQQALMHHEAWHCLALHLERRIIMLPFVFLEWWRGRCWQMEVDADAFAASRGYGVELLRFLRRYDVGEGTFYPPAGVRTEALERHIGVLR